MWTETELAYLAGIIDGEGCISITRAGRSVDRYTCQIFVANTNVKLVQWLRRFGGSVSVRARKKTTHKPLWIWLLSGQDVGTVLAAALPYLVIKQEQASLALDYRKTVSRIGANARLSDDIRERRQQLKSRLLCLNKRGAA